MHDAAALGFWGFLLDFLVLVTAALLLGALAERLRQSAILGYLLAGTLLGPHALDLLPSHDTLNPIAELGVALLLFTIGLEFSWTRVRRFGRALFGTGIGQVVVTGLLGAAVGILAGLDPRSATAIGAMIALSSTAAVLRLLYSRAELDSVHGRGALGVLLIQDLAVVPLVFLVTLLGRDAGAPAFGWGAAQSLAIAAAGIFLFFVLLRYAAPRLLGTRQMATNRDLSSLVAVVSVVFGIWGAHALGLSPALGAFVAGMILGESAFATQIRAEVAPLRILFMTLFFSAVGTQGDPAWALANLPLVLGVVGAVVVGKTAITAGVAALFGSPVGPAVATGLCLAQIGEFAFVLGSVGLETGAIDDELFRLVVTCSIVTLFLTPFLVGLAPRVSEALARRGGRFAGSAATEGEDLRDHVVLVGFGPAGQGVARVLLDRGVRIVVVDQNSRTRTVAEGYGVQVVVGDARREDLLDHVHVDEAAAVVITLPDPATARQLTEIVRGRVPGVPLVVRSRYHIHRWQLRLAGADEAVDEEEGVGQLIAEATLRHLPDAVRPDA